MTINTSEWENGEGTIGQGNAGCRDTLSDEMER
jgi:hypothetical protein